MDENKEKLTGSSPDAENIKDEMEELAKVFKEELDKAKKEAENEASGFENLEIDGYNPQTVSLGEKKTISEEELCEYCGERRRGTDKDPDGPYCSECEGLLEKYPYDYRGVIGIIVASCIAIAAIFLFALNVPLFSTMKQADKAADDGHLYTAINKYNSAVEYADNINAQKKCYNLHKKMALVCFDMVNMNSAISEIGDNIPESVLKLLTFKDVNEILDASERMQATAMVAQKYIGQYAKVNEETYDKIIADLDALSGKKIYIKGTEYHDETEEDFTPDGTETEIIADEGWLCMYKYAAAQQMNKDPEIIAEYLQGVADSSDYMKTLVGSLLATTYAGLLEDYEKAEELANYLKEKNSDSPEYHMVMSVIYRHRDKDYDKALKVCDEGLKMLEALPNGENYVMQYGYMLQVQQTLNFIMQDKYDEAYETIKAAYDNLSMTGGLTIQVRDLYAMLALHTKDTKTFEALELEIDSYGDESIAFTSDVTDYQSGKLTLKEIAESGRYDLI